MVAPSNHIMKPIDGLSTIRVVDLVSGDKDKRYEPAGRMAAAIIAITQKNGDCLPQDLNAQGFTPDEVAENWHLAKSLAVVELQLMDKKSKKLPSLFRGKP
jgi:hypothetical protein